MLTNKFAILLTCYNRKQTTLRCLEQLFSLKQDVDVYLVDDKSTDNTSHSIALQFPQVNIIQGVGNLFWSRGMHLAWQHAAKKNYDYYLWLNDDVVLYDNCFDELLFCSKSLEDKAIVSGIILSHDKKETLYGGTDKTKRLLLPNGEMQDIINMNGNIVLVPSLAFKILGNIDPKFHHDLGDVDYGLRATKKNLRVVTTRVAIGSGDRNKFCRVRLMNVNIKKRFDQLYSPLGNHPSVNFYFRKKHFGYCNALIYYFHIHLINLLSDNIVEFLYGNKYKY